MPYRIYGKIDGKDKQFRPLDKNGYRTNIEKSMMFPTKKSANEFLNRVNTDAKIADGAIFEIRSTNQ